MLKGDRILFFDIDGTLLYAKGIGRNAFSNAFYDAYKMKIDISHINFSGATDLGVLEKLISENNVNTTKKINSYFFERLAYYLELGLSKKKPKVFSGVKSFLKKTNKYSDFGLVTGNTHKCAKLKLKYSGLSKYFNDVGGYGDDDASRIKMTEIALERAGKYKTGYLFGDTPNDIQAAKSNNLISIALCTGAYDFKALSDCNPNIVLNSFKEAKKYLPEIFQNEKF